MGLDIYAGTLTRYYSHNWKTVVQQWAEENGWGFQKITPAGEPADNGEELSPAEVQAAVELYGFCPDVIDQGPQDATVGTLADVLRQSTVWYFWWD